MIIQGKKGGKKHSILVSTYLAVPHARKGPRVAFFSRGVIFTRAAVSLALLSLRKNGGPLVVYAKVGKGTYLHFSVILRPWVSIRTRESN